ncbi:hypothetical protein ACFQI9_17945 [Paraburkholderia dipogonis]|uniref:hypothetical protein n=1 Tax=Paraburkholderia dipogonis TaxID=1211383 RepID=UPI00361AF2D1
MSLSHQLVRQRPGEIWAMYLKSERISPSQPAASGLSHIQLSKLRCEMAGTARRRADRARIKKNRGYYWWGRRLNSEELGKVVDTPTPCSCWMCGNPRRYLKKDKLTVWEQRWFQQVDDD